MLTVLQPLDRKTQPVWRGASHDEKGLLETGEQKGLVAGQLPEQWLNCQTDFHPDAQPFPVQFQEMSRRQLLDLWTKCSIAASTAVKANTSSVTWV